MEQWERENERSFSLYMLVNDQDQELLDDLQDIAKESKNVRLTIQPVDASFPKTCKDEQQEEEENSPGFFDVISREEMGNIVSQQTRLNGSYLTLVALSAVVATIALIEGNVAILIGAMVLTPLLGPNLGLAFGTATANTKLIKRACSTGMAGIALTFLVSALTGLLFDRTATDSMVSMLVEYGFESIPIAICAGLAATILLLLQGTLSSLIGVMVAVAFLPPTAMTGLALSAGEYTQSLNAAMLLAINIAAFNMTAKAVLLVAGIRPHRDDEGQSYYYRMGKYIAAWFLAILVLSIGLYYKQ